MFSIDIYMHLMTWSVDFLKGVNRATWNHFVEGLHEQGHAEGGVARSKIFPTILRFEFFSLISVCGAGGWRPVH